MEYYSTIIADIVSVVIVTIAILYIRDLLVSQTKHATLLASINALSISCVYLYGVTIEQQTVLNTTLLLRLFFVRIVGNV